MRLILTVIALGLVGCVLAPPEPPPTSPDGDGNDSGDNPAGSDLTAARLLFDTNVYSTILTQCSGSACHSETATGATLTRFVSIEPSRAWSTAVNYQALVTNFTPTSAPVLTLIKSGQHHGAAYTTVEEVKITAWLIKELELRNGQQPQTPGNETLAEASERVLAEFAGCMTLPDFQVTNMADAWGGLGAQNNQQCEDCHTTGGEGFLATRNETNMWTGFSTRKAFFLQYLGVNLLDGAQHASVIVNTSSFRGVATAQAPHLEHPRFNPTYNEGLDALEAFYNLTMVRKAAGGCAPPRTFPM